MVEVQINGVIEELRDEAEKVIRRQPGFRKGHVREDQIPKYKLSPTSTRGVRLFAMVGGQWLDASLKDIEDEVITQHFTT